MADTPSALTTIEQVRVPSSSRVNPAHAYLARLDKGDSRRAQLSALRGILRLMTPEGADVPSVDHFAWDRLRAEHSGAIAAAITGAGLMPATSRRMTSALRGVLRASWRLGYMTAEELQRALDLPPVRGTTLGTGKALERSEVALLLDACPKTTHGARTAAIIALLFGGGLRRSEVVQVRMETLDATTRTVRVMGKGKKERLVPLGEWTSLLGAWIDARGREAGPLVCRLGRWHPPEPTRAIGPMAVYKCLTTLGATCGVKFSPHDGRRTAITDLLAAGVSLSLVQKFAGHSSPKTTANYDKSKETALIDAIDRAHIEQGLSGGTLSTRTPTRP